MNTHEWRQTPRKVSFVFQTWQWVKTSKRLRSKWCGSSQSSVQLKTAFYTDIVNMVFWLQSQYLTPHCWRKYIKEHACCPPQVINMLACLKSSPRMSYQNIPCCSSCVFFSSPSLLPFPTAFKKTNHLLIMLFRCWHDTRPQDKSLLWTLHGGAQLNVQGSATLLLYPPVSGQHKLRVKLYKPNVRAASAFRDIHLHVG